MNVKQLSQIPFWEWPGNAAALVLDTLTDRNASPEDRLLASELAGEATILSEKLADALLNIVKSAEEPEDLRCQSAISLGPGLEIATFEEEKGQDEPPPLSQPFILNLQQMLHQLYLDTDIPADVRRSVLEASVRYPEDWHTDAVCSAYKGNEDKWRLTAVFCMRHIRGFEDEILTSLNSRDPDIRYNAVVAAGHWALDAAWPTVSRLAISDDTEKKLRIAAIEAVAWIRPGEKDLLESLVDSYDEDISEAAMDALAEAGTCRDWDSEETDEVEEDDDWEDEDDGEDEDDRKK